MQIFNLIGLVSYPLALAGMLGFILLFSESLAFQIKNRVLSVVFLLYGGLITVFTALCLLGTYNRYTKLLVAGDGNFADKTWAVLWFLLAMMIWSILIVYFKRWNKKIIDFRKRG